MSKKKYKYQGNIYTCSELARLAGCSFDAMHKRIQQRKGVVTDEIICKRLPSFYLKRRRKYNYNGEILTIAQWANKAGINYPAMWRRIKINGYKVDQKILNSRQVKIYSYNGESLPLKEWARKSGLKYETLLQRVRKNDYQLNHDILQKKMPSHPNVKFFIKDKNDKKISLNEIAIQADLPYRLVYGRYKYGKKYRDIKKLGAPLYSL